MERLLNILHPETRVVVFDLDGTLYSKKGIVCRMIFRALLDWRVMLAERKVRCLLRGDWYGNKEQFYEVYFSEIARQSGYTNDYVRWWYTTRYMPLMVSVIGKYQKLAKWVRPFMEECHKLGVRMVVLSDYGYTYEKLRALGLNEKDFDWIVSAPELGGLKPAAELLADVANRMNVSTRQCLVIGDREDTDGEMAKSAGATFYLVKQ